MYYYDFTRLRAPEAQVYQVTSVTKWSRTSIDFRSTSSIRSWRGEVRFRVQREVKYGEVKYEVCYSCIILTKAKAIEYFKPDVCWWGAWGAR